MWRNVLHMGATPTTVVDLRAALVELREHTLIAAALARLASQALRRDGATRKVRGMVRRAQEAAEGAMVRARAVHEAVTIADGPMGAA